MTKTKQPKIRKNQYKYYEEFETIKDTPRNVAKIIMKQSPKKDWRFLAKKND